MIHIHAMTIITVVRVSRHAIVMLVLSKGLSVDMLLSCVVGMLLLMVAWLLVNP